MMITYERNFDNYGELYETQCSENYGIPIGIYRTKNAPQDGNVRHFLKVCRCEML